MKKRRREKLLPEIIKPLGAHIWTTLKTLIQSPSQKPTFLLDFSKLYWLSDIVDECVESCYRINMQLQCFPYPIY